MRKMNIQYLFAGFRQGTRVGGLPLAQILLLLGERNPLVSEGDGNADDIYTEDSSQFQLEIIMKNLENFYFDSLKFCIQINDCNLS